MKQLLSGKKIIKTFGVGEEKHRVLNEVSVTIGSGEFVSIMGPSGSGKSTLLYALSGMDGIDSGEVAFEGRRLSGLSDDALSDLRRNRMGFVFQQPTLLTNLNILDNIILPQTWDRKRNVKQLTAKARLLMRQMGICLLYTSSRVQAIRNISRKIQNCFILNWTLTKWQESMPLTGEKNMIGIKTTPYGGMK